MVRDQAGNGKQMAKQGYTIRESIGKSNGGEGTPFGGDGAIERKQCPRRWATVWDRTKTTDSERRRVRMVSIVEWLIGGIYGGGGIGGRLESVPVGVEKCVPWHVVWGRIGGGGRRHRIRRQDWGDCVGLQ